MARTFQEVKNPVRYKISETRPDGTKVGLVKILEFNSLLKGQSGRSSSRVGSCWRQRVRF